MKSPEAKLLLDSKVLFEGYTESNKATLTVVFNIVKVLLETGMFVSAAVGGFLDNTIPGESKIKLIKTWWILISHYCLNVQSQELTRRKARLLGEK